MAARGVPRRFGRVVGAVRRLPLTLSAATRRFAEDPVRGRLALERAVPALSRKGGRGLWARFDRAVAADDFATTTSLLEQVDATDPARPGAELALAGVAGRLTTVAEAAATDNRGRRAVRRASRTRDTLSAPLPTWCGPRDTVIAPGTGGEFGVLHVVTNSLPLVQAGSTIRTQRIARAQRDAGWDARVVTRPGFPVVRGEAWAADDVELDDVPYHRLLPVMMPSEAELPRVYSAMLERLVREVRPQVLHAASDQVNARAALEAGRRLGVPVAYEARSFFEDTWLSRHGMDTSADTYQLLRQRHDEILHAADVVTTLGEAMRAEIVRRGVPADRVVVAPNAVPVPFLAPRDDQARERRGLPRADLWVGSLATLNADEGFDTLLAALALLRDQGVDARALLVGSGPAREGLRQRAAELGVPAELPGRVRVDDVLGWYDALDVFAFPRADTPLNRVVTGLKPVEAQARGLPVVGSDLPAVREVLVPGSAVVRAGDATALAGALGEYVEPALRAELGGRGREWVAATRTWPHVVEAYRAAYSFGGISPA